MCGLAFAAKFLTKICSVLISMLSFLPYNLWDMVNGLYRTIIWAIESKMRILFSLSLTSSDFLFLHPNKCIHPFPPPSTQPLQWNRNKYWGTSLVAQWLRVCMPIQGTRIRALVWVDPTCHGATGPVSHNYWTRTPRAGAPQQEKPPQWEARAQQRN